MKAIILKKAGNPPEMTITNKEKPILKTGFSLVKMKSVTVNQLSNTIRTGKFGTCPEDFILGNEGTGIIEESDVFLSGDKVAIYGHNTLGITQNGLFQEWVLVENHRIIKLPNHLNFDEGSTLLVNYLTAYQSMKRIENVQKGDFVVIGGASGSVGHALVQISKALGALPIALVSSQEKAEKALNAGAFASINWKEENVVEKVKILTKNKGADFGFDPVGGDIFNTIFRSIKNRGTLVSIGFTGGLYTKINLLELISTEISIKGYSLFSESLEEVEQGLKNLMNLLEKCDFIKPDIDGTYILEDFEKAYEKLLSRQALGSITLHFD